MAEEADDERNVNSLHGIEDELVRELLDDETPFFFLPKAAVAEPEPGFTRESIMNKLISTVYSGPTIGDIESALSISFQTSADSDGCSRNNNICRPIIQLPEKGFSKMDNKYTMRIKSCANGMTEDGYKWRKYGQKSIKNSPNPRSYYRCTNPRCNAKKQVERSPEDPETLIVTYEGLHLHYTYSHFLLSRHYNTGSTTTDHPPPPPPTDLHIPKKPKIQDQAPPASTAPGPTSKPEGQLLMPGPVVLQEEEEEAIDEHESPPQQLLLQEEVVGQSPLGMVEEDGQSPQGLLEDIVPLLVRNPFFINPTTFPNEPSNWSQTPSPNSSSSSSLCWSPNSSYLD